MAGLMTPPECIPSRTITIAIVAPKEKPIRTSDSSEPRLGASDARMIDVGPIVTRR